MQVVDNKGDTILQQVVEEFQPQINRLLYVIDNKRDTIRPQVVDEKKKVTDEPTIGMIICKTKDSVEVQYSLEVVNQPIGVSEYRLAKLLPDSLKSSLPSIEELEEQLKRMDVE